MDMNKETQQKISKLQMFEQNMQQFLAQKQQMQAQMQEIDSAIAELGKTEKAYKIIGNVMFLSKKDQLEAELNQKKEMLNLRIKSIEKQEEQIREKSQSLQSEVLASMKDENKEE